MKTDFINIIEKGVNLLACRFDVDKENSSQGKSLEKLSVISTVNFNRHQSRQKYILEGNI